MIALLLLVSTALASETDPVNDLNEDLGAHVEDATPTSFHSVQLQVFTLYARQEGADDSFTYAPTLQWGLLPQTHLSAQSTGLGGDADKTGSGDLLLSLLWCTNGNRFGIAPRLALPTGLNREGVEPGLKLIVSQPFPDEQHRLHVNVKVDHATHPLEGERHNRLGLTIGYSWQFNERFLVIGDFVSEQSRTTDFTDEYAQAGAVFQPVKHLVVAAGFGVSAGVNAGDARANLSAQYSWGD